MSLRSLVVGGSILLLLGVALLRGPDRLRRWHAVLWVASPLVWTGLAGLWGRVPAVMVWGLSAAALIPLHRPRILAALHVVMALLILTLLGVAVVDLIGVADDGPRGWVFAIFLAPLLLFTAFTHGFMARALADAAADGIHGSPDGVASVFGGAEVALPSTQGESSIPASVGDLREGSTRWSGS